MNNVIITKEELLAHWLGHRNLTRKTIEKFPEEELFNFKVEGMRSFADMVKEIISIAQPGLESIVSNKVEKYNHDLPLYTKVDLLKAWDDATPRIVELFNQIPEERFKENFNLFGEYSFPIIHNLLYFIDNEIHHRAQGYVYLRSIGIVPPFFWERD